MATLCLTMVLTYLNWKTQNWTIIFGHQNFVFWRAMVKNMVHMEQIHTRGNKSRKQLIVGMFLLMRLKIQFNVVFHYQRTNFSILMWVSFYDRLNLNWIFQLKLKSPTFICWPVSVTSDNTSKDQNKLPFIYLKLTNNNAMFYNHFELKINFKRLNCSLLADRTCYFETDITDDLRSWLKQFNIEINEDEPKIHCYLYQDGTIGHVLYIAIFYLI